MSTYLKPIQVREKLILHNIKIFTPKIFFQIFNTNKISTKHFLETQTKQGTFARLKKGLYCLRTDQPTEQEIANNLYQPSYISFEYALSYYGLLPEMPYTITSATTKPTRNFTINSSTFLYRTIKKTLYTGYSLVKTENNSFLIADMEKAFLDYYYFVYLKKVPQNDRLIARSKQKTNQVKIQSYLKQYNNSKFTKFINSIL